MSARMLTPEQALGLRQAIEIENFNRIKWFKKNYETLVAENEKPMKKLTDGILWENIMKRRAETAQSTPRFPFRKVEPPPIERDLTVNLDIMKPVPPEIRNLIYQGISHEDEGPKGYLKVRYQEDPDDRFYMKDCTNWDYGWGIKNFDLHKLFRIPRIQIIQQTFYRRGKVDRDPDYYREATKTEAPIVFPQL